jgi:hypothetical protein
VRSFFPELRTQQWTPAQSTDSFFSLFKSVKKVFPKSLIVRVSFCRLTHLSKARSAVSYMNTAYTMGSSILWVHTFVYHYFHPFTYTIFCWENSMAHSICCIQCTNVEISETMKISRFVQHEWRYVLGHIFLRFRRGNEDLQWFEDFWIPQLFCRIIQSAKHSKPL